MIADYQSSIIALTVIQMLGVMSPGPDFAVVVRNSLIYNRKSGVLTAVGVSCGVLVHITYFLLGLGVLITKTAWLFAIIKYLGAGYLIYIGIKGLLAKKQTTSNKNNSHAHQEIAAFKVARTGFFTSAMNPKAILFFLSLISAFVTPNEPPIIVFIYGVIIFATTLIWFVFVAICFSNKKLRLFFGGIQYLIERITGVLLVLLGIKMLFV